jgi:hypothetical protein
VDGKGKAANEGGGQGSQGVPVRHEATFRLQISLWNTDCSQDKDFRNNSEFFLSLCINKFVAL